MSNAPVLMSYTLWNKMSVKIKGLTETIEELDLAWHGTSVEGK